MPLPHSDIYLSVSAKSTGQAEAVDYEPLSLFLQVEPSDFTPDGTEFTARKEVTLGIVDDALDEPDETLIVILERSPGLQRVVALSQPDGSVCPGRCEATVTITDNDEPEVATLSAGGATWTLTGNRTPGCADYPYSIELASGTKPTNEYVGFYLPDSATNQDLLGNDHTDCAAPKQFCATFTGGTGSTKVWDGTGGHDTISYLLGATSPHTATATLAITEATPLGTTITFGPIDKDGIPRLGGMTVTVTGSGCNTAPVIATTSPVMVAENGTAVVTLKATDADDDPIAWSKTGGADADRFALSATGVLTFVAAPDYESPADAASADPANAAANNEYVVFGTASDGTDGTELKLVVQVTNADEGQSGTVSIDDTAPMVGDALTASTANVADPDGLPDPFEPTWQWYRTPASGTEAVISAATSATYTVVAADVGAALTAKASWTDGGGFANTLASALSAPTAPAGICARTTQVRTAILGAISGVDDCAAVTVENLATITELSLGTPGLTSLQAGDFAGLTALQQLHLSNSRLTALPAGVFSGLTSLETLDLQRNQLSSLPAGVFAGLTSLGRLQLQGNLVDPLPVAVSLELAGPGQFKAVVPTAAPFVLRLRVSVLNGVIDGATTLTIPVGMVHSASVSVTRREGSTAAVTADLLTLPDLPLSGHRGYALEKSSDLPLEVFAAEEEGPTPVCDRTSQVSEEIVAQVSGVSTCREVTDAHLAAITVLELDSASIMSLKEDDFFGLTSLTDLSLGGNDLSLLPAGVFSGLTSLTDLNLSSNGLSLLPAGVFSGLTSLQEINLQFNRLSSLPAGVFSGLTSLTDLNLEANELRSLPGDVFSGLTSLQEINLQFNRLSSLPAGVFSGLTSLTDLNLQRNSVDPLPVAVSLELAGPGRLQAVAPSAAPFALTLPVRVVNGGATTLTIPAGMVRSDSVSVTRSAGSTSAVTADIGTLPGLPSDHQGYVLEKSSDLPLEVFAAEAGAPTPVCDRTEQVRDGIVALVLGVSTCGGVTDAHLAAITSLNLAGADITSLKEGDFSGLTSLETLNLESNELSVLPGGVFSGLTSLQYLNLGYNDISLLPAGVFSGLTSLQDLILGSNDISVLPDGVFSGLTSLETLSLFENEFSSLPAGVFSGLTSLRRLSLNGNPVDPLPVAVSLELAGAGRLRAVALTAAPFALTLPVSVVNGVIVGGDTRLTIPIGMVRSDSVSVTRSAGSTDAVTADIGTLPGLPEFHRGYFLEKSSGLPLNVLAEVPTLSALTVRVGGTDLLTFASGTTTYTATVDNKVETVTFAAATNTAGASVTYLDSGGDPLDAADTPAGHQVALEVGDNVITVRVTAEDSSAMRDYTVTVTRAAALPEVPTNFRVAPGNAQVVLSWAAPASDSGVTGHEFHYKTTGDYPDDWTEIANSAPGETNEAGFTVRMLTNEVAHTFELRAVNAGGNSAAVQAVPVTVTPTPGICDRTQKIQEVILAEISGVSNCAAVTEMHLAAITTFGVGGFGTFNQGITSLQKGDFAGLTSLTKLNLSRNRLTSLPEGIFAGLAEVIELSLESNQLASLPEGAFDGLVKLQALLLGANRLTGFPDRAFADLTALASLSLGDNDLSSLRTGVFSGLTALNYLYLQYNDLSSLRARVFSGLTALETLNLSDNPNADDVLPLAVTVEKVGTDQVRAKVLAGAPFAVEIPVTVANGALVGGAAALRVAAGSEESTPVTVTRTAGTTAAVTADVDLATQPSLPADHQGYVFARASSGLPATILPAATPAAPTGFTAKVGNAQVVLSWAAPASGSGVTRHEFRYKTTGDYPDDWTRIANSAPGETNEAGFTVPMLTNEMAHTFELRAVNAGGNSAAVEKGPVTPTPGICGRTQQVRDKILDQLADVSDCAAVTVADLATITALDFEDAGLASLQAGDFAGLTAMTSLGLTANSLSSLPESVFSGLEKLGELLLDDNSLDSLPAGVFSGLSALTDLSLNSNPSLGPLPGAVFSGLAKLEELQLSHTGLEALPAELFSRLPALSDLYLNGNRLEALPAGVFSGLSQLEALYLGGNSTDPLPLAVTVEKVGTDQVRAKVLAGAPFAVEIPVTVANGALVGGAAALEVAAGSEESTPVTVTRTAGTTAAVTADVDLATQPSLPADHQGYVFARASSGLPAEILPAALPQVTVAAAAGGETVAEGTDAAFTLSRTGSTTAALTVTVAVSETGAVLDDASAAPSSVTFDAGSATATLALATNDDDTDNDDGTVTVTLDAGTGYRVGTPDSATVEVSDNDTTNVAPSFTSAETFDAAENQTTVGMVKASDDDDDITGYALSGGADQALFAIDEATGALVFQTAPDYEDPQDTDTDNAYLVEVQATGGTGDRELTETQAITVTVTNADEGQTGTVSIDDTAPMVGDALTASTTGVADPDGLPDPFAPTWQWYRTPAGGSETEIAGATSATYTVVAADLGAVLTAKASWTDSGGFVNTLASAPTSAVTAPDSGTLPELSVADAAAAEGSAVTFTVTLSAAAAADVTATWTASLGTVDTAKPVDFTDLSAATETVTVTAGDTMAMFTVATAQDATDEDNETFTVTLSDASSNATLAADPTATGMIEDNDDPPTLSVQDQTVNEGDLDPDDLVDYGFPFPVTLSAVSEKRVRFRIRRVELADDTATAEDLQSGSLYAGTRSILAGDTVFYVEGDAIVNDALDEPDETFTLEIYGLVNATAGAKTRSTITIEDDDDPPSVSVADTAATEGDPVEFAVTLSAESGRTVTVDAATSIGSSDTAAAGDFTAVSATTLTFVPGDTAETVTVQTTEDAADESNETFTLTLSSPSNATLAADPTATGTIVDDDEANVAPSFTSPATFDAAENQTTVGTVEASDDDDDITGYVLSGGADQALFAIDGTSGALVFQTAPDYEDPQDTDTDNAYLVEVQATGGTGDRELTETQAITVTVTNADEGQTGTVSIDDTAPMVGDALTASTTGVADPDGLPDPFAPTWQWYRTPAGGSETEIAGATSATYTVVAADLGAVLTAKASWTDSGGFVNTLASAPTSAVTAPDSGTLPELSVADAAAAEGSAVTFTVTLSDASSNATLAADPTATGTIEDDDAVPALVIGHGSAPEDSAVEFTVSLTPASGRTVTAIWAVNLSGQTAELADFSGNSLQNGTVTFTPGQTTAQIQVAVVDDATDEPDETFLVNLAGATNARIEDNTATGTIEDNDDPPTLSVQDQTVNEGDQNPDDLVELGFPFRVALSAASEKRVRYRVRRVELAGDTATDADLKDGNIYLGIHAMQAGETVEYGEAVLILNDTLDEPDETFTVEIYDFENATAGAKTRSTITIEDDDDPPSVSVADTAATEGDPVEFTVTLSAASGRTVTVDAATSIGSSDTAAAGDFTAVSATTLTFVPGDTAETVTVQTTEDAADESNETFTVTLSSPSNATLAADPTATGTIVDDDEANVAPSFTSSATFDAAENQTTVDTVQAEDSDAGDDITGYAITGGADAGFFLIGATSGALTFDDAPNFEAPQDADTGNTYEVTVRATSGTGDREQTETLAITVTVRDDDTEAPGAPDAPSVSALSVTSLTVTWPAPDNAGPAITDYDYRYQTSSPPGTWVEVTTTTITVLSATITGLAENKSYDVQVRATNDEGTSGWSASGRGATDANAAPAFTSPAAFDAAENQTAAGTVMAEDSDDAVTGYAITGGADQGFFSIGSTSGVLTFQTAPDYEAPQDADTGNTYEVTVRATSGTGDREQMATLAITVTVRDDNTEAPDAPDAPSVSALSVSSLTVTWPAPDNAGPAITDYDYRYQTSSPAGTWVEVTTTTITGLSATIRSLQENTFYDVQVRATNDEGTGGWSASGSGATDANAAPAFTSPAAFDAAENQTAAGTVMAEDSDDAVTGYAITGGADQGFFSIGSTSGVLTFQTAPNFEAPQDADTGNTYEVTVRATSGTGDREQTATQTIRVTVRDANEQPDQPAKPTLATVSGSATGLAAGWTKPGLNGGPDITGYRVQYRVSTATRWETFTHSGIGVARTITGLTASTSYQVRVRALNGETPSEWSDPSDAVSTDADAPTPTPEEDADRFLEVTCEIARRNGVTDSDQCEGVANDNDAARTLEQLMALQTQIIDRLPPGQYDYYDLAGWQTLYKAEDGRLTTTKGGSSWTEEDQPEEDQPEEEQPQEPPPAPPNLTGVANSDGSIILSWDAPDDDTITGYQILRRRPTLDEDELLILVADTGSTATSYTDTEATPEVRHVYRVKAINPAGVGK